MARLTQAQRIAQFGKPGDERMIERVRTPWFLPDGKSHIYVLVHHAIKEPLLHSMAHAVRPRWTPKRIDSLAVRRIRGGTQWSLHAFGLAFDFFATPPGVPPPGGVWTPDNAVTSAFAESFTMHGFTWGGTWTRKDLPHIEWAGPPP